MIAVITEKPSVARDIAKVIGAGTNRGDWLEGNGYCVTWCLGHLLELDVPEAAGSWSREGLPIIPKEFRLKAIHYDRRPGQKARIDAVREVFMNCSHIVVATDAGREGELIFRNVYEFLGCRKPFKRLWISSLTDAAIAKGFEELHDGREFDNLALAAKARSEADWLVGINATRAMTVACGCRPGTVLSLGRVQTPTLCMICRRYLENKKFIPEPFWYIVGTSTLGGVTFRWKQADRFTDDKEKNISGEAECRAALDAVLRTATLQVISVKRERVQENPPLLFDIDALQKEANSRYGYTLADTLATAQSLYEKRLSTYPRTGSRYIPEDVFKTVPSLLQSICGNAVYGNTAKSLLGLPELNRRSVNDTKITDHHAIIITENRPDDLPGDKTLSDMEANVYGLIMERFLEAFSPACEAYRTKVEMLGGGLKFIASGRKELKSGWRTIRKLGEHTAVELSEEDGSEMDMTPLPEMNEGDVIPVGEAKLVEDKTKPKPLLTDATLLTEMEQAGSRSDDRDVAKALKEIGIGTPATRAETLETLVARRFVNRVSGKLVPTELGMEMYLAVRDKAIANVTMTAKWEIALDEIADGKRDTVAFGDKIKEYTRRLTAEILSGGGLERMKKKIGDLAEKDMLKCPKCGHEMKLLEKSVWCNQNKGGCGYSIYRTVAKKDLSDASLRALVQKGSTGVISGFVGKNGNTFEARLVREEDGRISFDFPKDKRK